MRKPKAPQLVTVAIITTATIIFWIFFEVYRIFTTPPPVDVPEELLRPINPSLESQVLQNIESRNYFEETDIPEAPIVPIVVIPEEVEPTPTPQLSPPPTATESAEIQ